MQPVPGPFAHPRYLIKRPFFSFLGRTFHVFAPDGPLVMKHPILRLRDEPTIGTDETERVPLLTVRNRAVLAVNMAHHVIDARSGERTGSIRSRGLRSIVRDRWDILDERDQPVGLMQEDGAAMLRRFFPIPDEQSPHRAGRRGGGAHPVPLDGSRREQPS